MSLAVRGPYLTLEMQEHILVTKPHSGLFIEFVGLHNAIYAHSWTTKHNLDRTKPEVDETGQFVCVCVTTILI